MIERAVRARISRNEVGTRLNVFRKKERSSYVSREQLMLWQRMWDEASQGRWPHEWVPQVGWEGLPCGRKAVQLVTGHGNFTASLSRFGLREGPSDCECGGGAETARHLALDCTLQRCREEREKFMRNFGVCPPLGVITKDKLEGLEQWAEGVVPALDRGIV